MSWKPYRRCEPVKWPAWPLTQRLNRTKIPWDPVDIVLLCCALAAAASIALLLIAHFTTEDQPPEDEPLGPSDTQDTGTIPIPPSNTPSPRLTWKRFGRGIPYNGPDGVNRSVLLERSEQESESQYLDLDKINGNRTTGRVGRVVAAHDNGILVSTVDVPASFASQRIRFYRVGEDGKMKDTQTLEVGAWVVNMQFCPMFNIRNEVYYLYVSVNTRLRGPVVGSLGMAVADEVRLYTCSTNTADQTGLQWNRSQTTLTHPFYRDEWGKGLFNGVTPFHGSFGDRLMVSARLEQTFMTHTHELFVVGTDYPGSSAPGNGIYWYVMDTSSNSTRDSGVSFSMDPIPLYLSTIKDAKTSDLRRIGKAHNYEANARSREDILCGFGHQMIEHRSTSGGRVLIVSNPGKDDVDIRGGNSGYVQAFEFAGDSNTGVAWPQPFAGNASELDYRFRWSCRTPSTPYSAGFGVGLCAIQDHLLITCAAFQTQNADEARRGVTRLSHTTFDMSRFTQQTGTTTVEPEFIAVTGAAGGSVFVLGPHFTNVSGTAVNEAAPEGTPPVPAITRLEIHGTMCTTAPARYDAPVISGNMQNMYATHRIGTPYHHRIFMLDDDELLVATPCLSPAGKAVTLYRMTFKSPDPFFGMEVAQHFPNVPVTNPTSADLTIPFAACGQYCCSWLSANGTTRFLAVNDPHAADGAGAIYVYAKVD